MKTAIWTLSFSSLALCSHLAVAGQSVSESKPASSSSFIKIEHVNGKADIRGWDEDEVKVEGELGDRTEEFIFREKGGDIRIEVEVEKSGYGNWRNWDSDDGDDLIIYVPFGASVNYESINATLLLTDLSGKTEAEVINGDIEAKNLSGKVRIESVNGNIEVDKVDGDLSIETVNGDIRGSHVGTWDLRADSVNGSIRLSSESEEIEAETVNGDLELELGSVKELGMTSVNGDIEVVMELQDGGDVNASTVGGHIELTFQKGVSARFEIEAHAGGRIKNGITNDKMQKAKYGPRRWLNFATGSGSAQVELSTVSGKIEVDTK